MIRPGQELVRELGRCEKQEATRKVFLSRSQRYSKFERVMTELSQRAVPLTNALLMNGKKCNTLEAESSLNEKVSTERVEHIMDALLVVYRPFFSLCW